MAKLVRDVTIEHVNRETGEVRSTTREQVIQLPNEPPFVKLYLDDIAKLFDLPARTSDTIHALLRQMNFDSIITLTAPAKRRIAEQLGTSVSTIENQLSKLVSADILRRIDRGEYMLNPSLFARGAWTDVRKLRDKYFELKVTYGPAGERKVKGQILDQEPKGDPDLDQVSFLDGKTERERRVEDDEN